MRKVLVSVLNWNTAGETISCVDSILRSIDGSGLDVAVMVVDNGSGEEDRNAIESYARSKDILFRAERSNLGFAGGHNLSIGFAASEGIDYVWLINSDAEVGPGVLERLLELMEADPICGSASPLIVKKDDPSTIEFCGAIHQPAYCSSHWATSPDEGRALEEKHAGEFWIVGTAVLFRMEALKRSGHLNDEYFAYYEDDDISARLSLDGWRNRMVFDASVGHGYRRSHEGGRPDYYYYLMARNHLAFWWSYLGRKGLARRRVRLFSQTLFGIEKMRLTLGGDKHQASMLGAYHFITGKMGKPRFDLPEPVGLRLLRLAARLYYSKPIRKLGSEGRLAN